MEDSFDPIIPSSEGALLAEECTIDPYSTLPSFLEMLMIEDGARQSGNAILSVCDQAQQHLGMPYLTNSQLGSTEDRREDSFSGILRNARLRLYRCVRFLRNVLRRNKWEIQCLVMYMLERQSLQSHASARLSESVYGTKRMKVDASSTTPPDQKKLTNLSGADRTRLALLLVIVPYLKQKLEERAAQVGRSRLNGQASHWRRILFKLLPTMLTAPQLVNIWLQWRYLLGVSLYYDPSSWLLGQVVRRISHDDNGERQPEKSASSDIQSDSLQPSFSKLQEHFLKRPLLYVVSGALFVSWATQLRVDWQAIQREQSVGAHDSTQPQSIPPPPASPHPKATLSNLCPLCHRTRIHPTASTSGYVFCFSCLTDYVRKYERCPVTSMGCKEYQLIRLYEPRSDENSF